jgi:hypothetical protein
MHLRWPQNVRGKAQHKNIQRAHLRPLAQSVATLASEAIDVQGAYVQILSNLGWPALVARGCIKREKPSEHVRQIRLHTYGFGHEGLGENTRIVFVLIVTIAPTTAVRLTMMMPETMTIVVMVVVVEVVWCRWCHCWTLVVAMQHRCCD